MTATLSIDVRSGRPTLVSAPPSWFHAPARASSPQVLRFCAHLSPSISPVEVPVRPELLYGFGPAPMGRCHQGVDEYIQRVGGTFRHGWMLWETQGIYLRAFHHCVHWDGTALTDVSPQSARKILLLPTAKPGEPDEAYREAKRQGDPDGVRSRYFPLGDSPTIRRIVSLHQAKEEHRRYSPEWSRLLEEAVVLEERFHDYEAKSAVTRRPRLSSRKKKSRR